MTISIIINNKLQTISISIIKHSMAIVRNDALSESPNSRTFHRFSKHDSKSHIPSINNLHTITNDLNFNNLKLDKIR